MGKAWKEKGAYVSVLGPCLSLGEWLKGSVATGSRGGEKKRANSACVGRGSRRFVKDQSYDYIGICMLACRHATSKKKRSTMGTQEKEKFVKGGDKSTGHERYLLYMSTGGGGPTRRMALRGGGKGGKLGGGLNEYSSGYVC